MEGQRVLAWGWGGGGSGAMVAFEGGGSRIRQTRLLHPWDFPGKNAGLGSLSLLQGIFPIHELNQGLLHCRQILYQLSY